MAAPPTSPRTHERLPGRVSCCFVDAGGVPAEWVEVRAATSDQPTIVHFARSLPGRDSRASDRPLAAKLASVTGARVLTVDCRRKAKSELAVIDEGIAAWVWLLNEGCESRTTAFTSSPFDGTKAWDVLLAAHEQGLLPPFAGAWCVSSVASTPSTARQTDLRSCLIQAGARELGLTRP